MDVEYLKECFEYNFETGELIWKKRPLSHFKTARGCAIFNGQNSGKVAGNKVVLNGKLYKSVFISSPSSGKRMLQHRVIWCILNGKNPCGVIDHINGNGSDNRIENLRDVTMSGNHKNKMLTKSSKTGKMGVSYMKSKGKWRARICSDGKEFHIGLFENIEDAIYAREKAEINFGFHENHGRKEEFCK